MSRLQLGLNVDNIEEVVNYYSALFDTQPAKIRRGYANFAITDPPLKLVVFEGACEPGSINHTGIEQESAERVHAELARIKQTGSSVHNEGEDHCCAHRDEGWFFGDDGETSEIYTALADAETAGHLDSNAEAEPCCVADGMRAEAGVS